MTETVTLKLGKSMKAELRALADADKRTLSNYLAIVLERFIEEKRADKKRGSK